MFDRVYAGKTVLVTGSTGFKGSWLVLWLRELGAEVVGLADGLPTRPCHFEVAGLDRSLPQRTVDVRDFEALAGVVAQVRPDLVFHLAAQSLVRRSLADPLSTFQTNTQGTWHLLEALRREDRAVPTVVVTSDKCYRNREWAWGYRESDELGGDDPYSASKGAAELVCRAYVQSYPHLRVATARAGNVIGGGDWAADRVVPDCMRAWLQGQKPLIRNPQATRPWQHVLEPLSGYLWLGARLAREGERLRGEAYNFGPAASHTHSVRALLERMRAHWPEAAWDERAPGGASDGEATLLQLNCDKAFAELGWRTVLDLETAAGMTVDWYRAYQAGQAMDRFAREQIAAYVEAAREQGLGWSDDE